MNSNPPIRIKVKTAKEILTRLKDLISRHRKRFYKNKLKPKGENCAYVVYNEELDCYKCTKCGTTDPDNCLNASLFHPSRTKEELSQDFADDIRNTQRMLREYRDVATLLWVLSQFDDPAEYESTKENLIANVEQRNIPDQLEGV
jgi:hypothetical protein